jgi:hypothetical protein
MPGHGTRNRHHRDQFKVQSTNCERHNQIPSAKRGPPGIINPDVSAGSNRKKARREGASVPNFAGPVANRRQQDRQQPQIAVPMNIHDLPDELLLLVFEKLQMHRFPAASGKIISRFFGAPVGAFRTLALLIDSSDLMHRLLISMFRPRAISVQAVEGFS